ncbi:MAG: toprim domain-containing protein [Thiotrichales bacterium]|nr:toprim domain-containing protein [Thiotrichales bacterium]
MVDVRLVKQKASGRWLEIFENLAPALSDAVKKCGGHVPDPVVGGVDGFRLFKDAPQTGAAYANKAGGALGDGIETLMYVTGRTFKQVLDDVAAYLGIDGKQADSVPVSRVMQAPQQQVWQPSPQEIVERKSKLNNYWQQASKMTDSRSMRAAQYLRSRGITKNFSSVPDFRFHPATWYKDANGELQQTPAFIQLWRDAEGTPVNIHKILLDKDGVGKAKLQKPKLQMKPSGRMTGGAIRLGEPAFGTLSVSTGVETALSVMEVTDRPCWSCLNDALLRGFIPPQGINHLTIWADNDKLDANGRNSGVSSAEALRDRLATERPEIKVVLKIPPVQGEDWNDLLMKGDTKAFYG